MPQHRYSPAQALELLLRKLDERVPLVASQIRTNIDQGRLGIVEFDTRNGKQQTEKTVPFTDEEALSSSLDILRAYFLEIPFCIQSLNSDFAACTLGSLNESNRVTLKAELVPVAIEIYSETARFQAGTEPLEQLPVYSEFMLDEQRENVQSLSKFLDFTE